MNDIQDGGPAFPVQDSHHANGMVQYGCNGMSLRDWFAGQMLAGIVAQQGHYLSVVDQVDLAYHYADTMIKRRIATTKEPTP
jgi:hypothetical protein